MHNTVLELNSVQIDFLLVQCTFRIIRRTEWTILAFSQFGQCTIVIESYVLLVAERQLLKVHCQQITRQYIKLIRTHSVE